jgi:hypothetical protein
MFGRDEYDPIPDQEVNQEWLAATIKTGLTDNLVRARHRLPVLLSMKPETVEAYMKTIQE